MTRKQNSNGQLLTVSDVAERWQVGKSTIYDWLHQQKIPHVVLSQGNRKSTVRFRRSDLEAFEEANQR